MIEDFRFGCDHHRAHRTSPADTVSRAAAMRRTEV